MRNTRTPDIVSVINQVGARLDSFENVTEILRQGPFRALPAPIRGALGYFIVTTLENLKSCAEDVSVVYSGTGEPEYRIDAGQPDDSIPIQLIEICDDLLSHAIDMRDVLIGFFETLILDDNDPSFLGNIQTYVQMFHYRVDLRMRMWLQTLETADLEQALATPGLELPRNISAQIPHISGFNDLADMLTRPLSRTQRRYRPW